MVNRGDEMRPASILENGTTLERTMEVIMSAQTMSLLSIVACAALLAMPALAGDDVPGGPGGNRGNGVCRLDGAWLGGSPVGAGPAWTVVYKSDSHWQGSLTLNMIGFDGSFGGVFPVTMLSPFSGTWVRTGPRTFEYTMITYGLGPDPVTGVMVPFYIGKNTGSVELTDQCDVLDGVSISNALYLPTQDPFGDGPPLIGCFPDGTFLTAQRIPVEPPCEPAPP